MTALTTQSPKPQAFFPDVPRNERFLKENGEVSDNWKFFFESLVSALQTNFKPEGLVVPSEIAANIALLTKTGAMPGDATSVGNILYDSTNNAFKGNVNGTWKTFTLT